MARRCGARLNPAHVSPPPGRPCIGQRRRDGLLQPHPGGTHRVGPARLRRVRSVTPPSSKLIVCLQCSKPAAIQGAGVVLVFGGACGVARLLVGVLMCCTACTVYSTSQTQYTVAYIDNNDTLCTQRASPHSAQRLMREEREVCARCAARGGAHQKLPFFAAQHTIEDRRSSQVGKPSHCPGAHASIFLGSSWFDRSSPWPRQPYSPSPHAKTAPSAATARLW